MKETDKSLKKLTILCQLRAEAEETGDDLKTTMFCKRCELRPKKQVTI